MTRKSGNTRVDHRESPESMFITIQLIILTELSAEKFKIIQYVNLAAGNVVNVYMCYRSKLNSGKN